MNGIVRLAFVAACAALGAPAAVRAEEPKGNDDDEFKGIPAEDLRIGKDADKRWFSIGPREGERAPAGGYGLVVVLPGSTGDETFQPFVKRIYREAVPKGYVCAQPVAKRWDPRVDVTWPTEKTRVPKMKFTTEEFVAEVIDEASKRVKVDPARVFTLSWSSGGPPAYAISLTNPRVTGSFVAMSVFRPDSLPSLKSAKGRPYFLYHSPEDKTCAFTDAEAAVKALEKNGAAVKLAKYAGGHGWHGDVYGDIRAGLDWLEKNHAKPPPKPK